MLNKKTPKWPIINNTALPTGEPLSIDCTFCRIISGSAQALIFFRDDRVIAFQDIRPRTPVHILIVPVRHISTLNDTGPDDIPLLGHMVSVARQLAVDQGISQSGYRLMINTGPHAGQSVFHIHLHLLGGRHMPFRLE